MDPLLYTSQHQRGRFGSKRFSLLNAAAAAAIAVATSIDDDDSSSDESDFDGSENDDDCSFDDMYADSNHDGLGALTASSSFEYLVRSEKQRLQARQVMLRRVMDRQTPEKPLPTKQQLWEGDHLDLVDGSSLSQWLNDCSVSSPESNTVSYQTKTEMFSGAVASCDEPWLQLSLSRIESGPCAKVLRTNSGSSSISSGTATHLTTGTTISSTISDGVTVAESGSPPSSVESIISKNMDDDLGDDYPDSEFRTVAETSPPTLTSSAVPTTTTTLPNNVIIPDMTVSSPSVSLNTRSSSLPSAYCSRHDDNNVIAKATYTGTDTAPPASFSHQIPLTKFPVRATSATDSTTSTSTMSTNGTTGGDNANSNDTSDNDFGKRALNLHSLYDRDKDLFLLRQEYTSMVKRARGGAGSGPRTHRNLTSVVCVSGKAGTGKSTLVRTFMNQEIETSAKGKSSNSSTPDTETEADRSPFFLFGKFDWPTSSVTSSLKARPHVPNSASMATGDSVADDTQYQPALAQVYNTEQEKHHEPFAAFCMALEHLLQQIEAKGPVMRDKLRSRILQSIGGPSSIPVLGELTPKFASFLEQNVGANGTGNANETTAATQSEGFPGAGASSGASSQSNGYKDRPSSASTGNSYSTSQKTNNKPSATESTFNSAPTIKNIPVEHRIPRLKHVLRQLFRSLCRHNQNPCVLILDDAQWADVESLELAHDLHADLENPLFLLILTWRTNDIHEEESCYTAMGSSIGIFADDLVRRINLQNLSTDAVAKLVAQTIKRPTSDVRGLSQVVHQKTSGNPLFVHLFLEYLEKERYLTWNEEQQHWEWEDLQISDLNISNNFLGLIVAKILRLSTPSRVVLQILSCLGQAFEEESVCTIIDKMDTVDMFDINIDRDEAVICLNTLVKEGLLERHSSTPMSAFQTHTTFVHDQMQEAAYQLIPKHSRQKLQLRIGERLLEIMEEQRSEYVSFLGIDLCSKGIGLLSSKERMGLSLYNLLAGEKCLSRASFATALAYFEFGLSSLRIGDFLKGRLSLELSFGAMEAAFGVDDFDKVCLHYDRITGSGTTPEDNLRAHILLIRATGTRGNLKQALATGFSVLRSLGVKTIVDISNKVSLFVHIRKTKMALRKHSEDSLAAHVEMTSTKLRHAMRIVEAMLPFAYMHDQQLFMCLTMKIVRWSLKYGVTGQTPMVFAALGSSPVFQSKDMNMATALGNAALRLMERFETRENSGMIRFVIHSQIRSWSVEPQVVHQNLEWNCRTCLLVGDLFPAFCSLANAYAISFDCGRQRLDEMETLGETYSLEIIQGGNRVIAGIHDATWQMVMNLRCDSSDLKSKITSALTMTQGEALSYGNHTLEFAFLSRDLQLAYLLGDHHRAEEIRKKSEAAVKSMGSSPHLILHICYCALNCLALCGFRGPEPARKNAFYKLAVQHVTKLNYWQKNHGYRFAGHLVKLIQAEFSRVEERHTLAEKNYQSSVWIAARQGNHRDKGLAHELAGKFFLREKKDETWAAYHFDQAIQAYHSWGATLLVNRLLDKFGDVVSRDAGRSDLSSQLLSTQTSESSVV